MRTPIVSLCLIALSALAAGCDGGDAEPAPDAAPLDAAPDLDRGPDPDAAPEPEPDAAPDAAEPEPDAGPPPPAPLGYRAEEITYTPIGAEAERTLPVFWWYPTAAEDGPGVLYRVFPADRVFDGVPPALDAPAPLLVFSHGRSGFGQYSYFLAEHFARRGFVVLAVDHIGDTLTDAVDSPEIYRQRPQDISAVIDHGLDPGPDHPLAGLVGSPIVVAGHSFGGYTALAIGGADYATAAFDAECPDSDSPFCAGYTALPEAYAAGFADPRVDLIMPLAPGNHSLFRGGLGAVDVPVLLMTGARDRNTPDETSGDPIWADLPDDPRHRRVRFTTGGHFTFTDLCPIVGALGRDNGCSEGDIPTEVAHPIITAFADAFIDRHLFGGADAQGDALLDGDTSPHPEVYVVEKEAE